MNVAALLAELYGRIPPLVQKAVDGVDPVGLTTPPAPGANTIAWLLWHLTRVQDHHISEILDVEQIWTAGDWAPRFGLEGDPSNTGYGHSAQDMAAVRPDGPDAILRYLEAVDRRTATMFERLTPDDLDRIVDRRWEPPVTLGVRLVSIADDSLQHAGQAAYVRGILRSGA